ncbi:SDR family NAD(P)-dependent oxidoreductase [Arthrobacter sulfonylureivorans]|uniref:SDR family NAD(P)-dependent oxidoreductase n=1 Tax=Arthrobacter sulfonylureivorans TaxID=2486855 RepID=UPI0039E39579
MSASSRVAVITGGAGAFGSAIAARLAEDGFRVVLADADAGRAATAAAKIPGASSKEMDVTSAESVHTAVAGIGEELGRIDVVVNNAGVAPPGGMTTTALDAFDRTLSINLRGSYLVTSAAMPWLQASEAPRVVMIGSRTWLSGGNPAYTASKAGIVGLCRSVAQELGPFGGTCNVVAPGPVDTAFVDGMGMGADRAANFERYIEQTPLRRTASPDDVARAAAFFAGDGASFITGEVLHVAGGLQLAPKL